MAETSTTTDTTATTRPTSHDDLPDYQRQGHLVAQIPADHITRYPSLGQHLLAALAEADHLQLVRTPDGAIRIPRTTEELDASLAGAQKNWDTSARWYEDARMDPAAVEVWKRSSVDHWAKAEGRDPIVWDAQVSV